MRPRRLTANPLTPPAILEAQPFRRESEDKREARESLKEETRSLGLYFRDRTRSNGVHSQCDEHATPVRLRDYQDHQHHWSVSGVSEYEF